MSDTPQYIGEVITVSADSPATRIPLPSLDSETLPTQSIVRLYVRISAAATELVSEPSRTKGLPIPATTLGTAFEAGTWRLGPGLELYLYAASPTSVEIIPIYESKRIEEEG